MANYQPKNLDLVPLKLHPKVQQVLEDLRFSNQNKLPTPTPLPHAIQRYRSRFDRRHQDQLPITDQEIYNWMVQALEFEFSKPVPCIIFSQRPTLTSSPYETRDHFLVPLLDPQGKLVYLGVSQDLSRVSTVLTHEYYLRHYNIATDIWDPRVTAS